MRARSAVLLLAVALAGCGYNDENRPLVRAVGIGAGAGALAGTLAGGPPVGTVIGAIWGAGLGGVTGYAIENWPGPPAMATLPAQFDGKVAVALPGPPPPPPPDTRYKPFGDY